MENVGVKGRGNDQLFLFSRNIKCQQHISMYSLPSATRSVTAQRKARHWPEFQKDEQNYILSGLHIA